MPNDTHRISTGIASAFSSNYVAMIKERSSTGLKGMGLRGGIIDSGYRGEWILVITNHNCTPLTITKNQDAVPFHLRDGMIHDYNKALAQALFIEMNRKEKKENHSDGQERRVKNGKGLERRGNERKGQKRHRKECKEKDRSDGKEKENIIQEREG